MAGAMTERTRTLTWCCAAIVGHLGLGLPPVWARYSQNDAAYPAPTLQFSFLMNGLCLLLVSLFEAARWIGGVFDPRVSSGKVG